jgi:hypothetical protein
MAGRARSPPIVWMGEDQLNPLAVAAAICVAAVAVSLSLYHMRRLGPDLNRVLARSDEKLVIGPETGHYTAMIRGIIATQSYGVIALTDRRLIFRKPIGRDIEIPLSQIAEVSENKWWAGNYRNGRLFLIVKLADGRETAFQVKNHERWMRELRSRLAQA